MEEINNEVEMKGVRIKTWTNAKGLIQAEVSIKKPEVGKETIDSIIEETKYAWDKLVEKFPKAILLER